MKRSILFPVVGLAAFVLFTSFFFLSSPLLPQSDEDCMACHEDPELENAEGKSLYVDSEQFQSSIHGEAGFSCVGCHSDLMDVEDFPHSEKLNPVS
jgi:hypothetical protein